MHIGGENLVIFRQRAVADLAALLAREPHCRPRQRRTRRHAHVNFIALQRGAIRRPRQR